MIKKKKKKKKKKKMKMKKKKKKKMKKKKMMMMKTRFGSARLGSDPSLVNVGIDAAALIRVPAARCR
ncbi:unnamed protein product [Pleuronectes platessa]|uniref:Uncharacterized protein n=1 Tax=Pleuronectes platessa TaxID=8262 RepID=A0A9N7URA1_PLEPL|nr:unnamed protein product [Pleuronectes platessa]